MSSDFRFEANVMTILEVLFSPDNRYQIPRYQRPYTWDEEQLSDFWNDLTEYNEPYFLGSFIFNYETYNDSKVVDIIDGQQRILTLTILSAVLRDIASDINPEVSRLIQRKEIAFEDHYGEQSFRIIPGDSAKDFFENYIQKAGNSIFDSTTNNDEEANIKKNYEYFHKEIVNFLEKLPTNESKLKFLNNIRDKVADLKVIKITIYSEDEAYEIFETTNARGIDLSVGDLLKNLIFKKLPPNDDKDFAKDQWQDLTENVQSTNTDLKRFLRYYWISKHSFVHDKKLFKEIKKRVINWEEFLVDLWDSSEWYRLLFDGNESEYETFFKKKGHEIYRSTFSIKLMDVSQCYILFLSLLRHLDQLPANLTRIFQAVESFTFQYSAVCKQPGNKLEKIYSKFAREIEGTVNDSNKKHVERNINSIFGRLLNELKEISPSYDFFMENFDKIVLKNSQKSRMLIKYILDRINSYYKNTDEQITDFNRVNLEHILPQKPEENWNLTKNDIKDYVNKIGNLTILSTKINSSVQNNVIEKKIEEYRKSELAINKELVKDIEENEFKWDKEIIEQRQRKLANIAYNHIWKLN